MKGTSDQTKWNVVQPVSGILEALQLQRCTQIIFKNLIYNLGHPITFLWNFLKWMSSIVEKCQEIKKLPSG